MKVINLVFDAIKYFVLLTIAFLVMCYFQSCKTCKEAEKITIIKDSISYVEKIVRDTIRPTAIVGPVMWLPNPCSQLCDSVGKLKKFEFITRKNGIKQTLKSIDNVLVQNCDADSLKLVIERLEKEKTIIRSEKTKEIIEVNKLAGFNKFLAISGLVYWIILIVSLTTYLYIRIKK